MNTPPGNAAPNFDRLARTYRWLEYFSFGTYLERARLCFLRQLRDCRRALVLGDGDGRFTAQLLASNPQLSVHAVDGSAQMLSELRRNAGTCADRASTEVADLRQWQPGPGECFDLIATHFFLDCLTTDEIAALVRRLEGALAPGALWIVSDFHVPSDRFGHFVAARLIACLYAAFRVLTGLKVRSLPEHAPALAAGGWLLIQQRSHLRGLLISQLWQLAVLEA